MDEGGIEPFKHEAGLPALFYYYGILWRKGLVKAIPKPSKHEADIPALF